MIIMMMLNADSLIKWRTERKWFNEFLMNSHRDWIYRNLFWFWFFEIKFFKKKLTKICFTQSLSNSFAWFPSKYFSRWRKKLKKETLNDENQILKFHISTNYPSWEIFLISTQRERLKSFLLLKTKAEGRKDKERICW